MNNLEYFRGSFKEMRVQTGPTDQKSIIIRPLFDNETVDYSNPNNLSSLAYNARKSANGLYNLVMDKYNSNHPAYISEFEMLVALINLSSELYMKSIIYYYHLNNGKQYKGHHGLDEYFSMLPEDIKSNLKTIDDNFEIQLKDISYYFNKFRYSFEFNTISTNSFAFSLAIKLNQICNSITMQQPPEVIASKNRLLLKQGDNIVWDSSKDRHA